MNRMFGLCGYRIGRLGLLSAVLIFGLVIPGCDSQSSDDEGDSPPALFSADIFSVQTDLFSGAPKGGQSKFNFAAAAFRVWPVSLILTAHTIIPVAITAAALNDTPEFVEDAWEWSTTVPIQQSNITFTLYGRPSGSQVNWMMDISGSDPVSGVTYDTFQLFSATTTVGEQSGSWQLFYEIDGVRTNVLDATFDVTDADTKMITYSIPQAILETGGDSVTYESDGDSRNFLWQQVNLGESHAVTWDAATHEGSVTSTTYNGGDKACWNGVLDDIPCTS